MLIIIKKSRLYSTSDEEVEDEDPYGDLLNFKKPVETENSKDLINIWSIASSIDSGSLVKVKGPPKTAQQQWEHWDDFMEEQFGNMDAEVPESESWQIDMRDMVEQKRGFAIWSKKSEKELQRELKKALEKKALNVPSEVEMIVRAVYLEKTQTIKSMKRDYELDYITFRKWVIEQKKKTKKDPLPLAKAEVSKKWLTLHPNTSMGYSSVKNKVPAVVMDDCTVPVFGVAFGSNKGNAATSGAGTTNTLVTSSMLNWEKVVEDMPQKKEVAVKSKAVKTSEESFMIDEDEMYIASLSGSRSLVEEDYFVVI
eukprot:CAMPEP_0119034622 /NCGR_PEP_ID=MMETSP1177-20130426/1627_1 /TAXON_ID=2985 /ORGANISM="Ochromonas sp, Strain CCMP1899" /LENGTH=310 /DNA_ID=CAMNT_0006992189 /DNA_START=224 /DNA_END=1157 /DNA_ORIENTATION=-